jgi:putative RNA 2'-phosphotransferase
MIDLVKKGKFLALILRHNPEVINIKLDKNGWANVKELITKGDYSLAELKEIVKTDNKGRYEFNTDQSLIRACQGHSVNVDVELVKTTPPEFLYHGTKEETRSSIFKKGLIPMSRQYVHLTSDIKTAENTAGRRKGESVILTVHSGEMSKSGIDFFLSKNNVWLVKEVPPKFIEGISTFKFK